jgi:hypothetical protein
LIEPLTVVVVSRENALFSDTQFEYGLDVIYGSSFSVTKLTAHNFRIDYL